MATFLKQFFFQNKQLFVTEFGHSILEKPKTVGPWSRDIYILHFVVNGYCDFSGFRAEKGQAFLISKGLRHSFTVSKHYEHYWIGFSGNGVEDFFEKFALTSRLHQLYFVDDTDFAKTLFSLALQKLQNDDLTSPDIVPFSVLTAMLPLLSKESHFKTPSKTNYAEKIKSFIQTNYIYPIKMAEISREIFITEKYMYRLFLNKYGISPQKFLLQTRMEAAKIMLTETDCSIKEVAYSVGYSTLPSFSKAFAKYFGISPSLFKKQDNSHNRTA